MIPMAMLARLLPGDAIELVDRVNSFLYLPLSVLVADGVVRWLRARPPRQVMRARTVAVVLATAVFLGGFLVGSGPDPSRLPGGYLPAAGGRSMDAEALAAARWAHDALPPGSRIAADGTGARLMATQADLWPVAVAGNGLGIARLYFSPGWGPKETATVDSAKLRYLYVDRRLADGLPLFGFYFAEGETEEPTQLTIDQLTKFDLVTGVRLIYRHGPISIYDLSGLGLHEVKSGWTGTAKQMSVVLQLAMGLLVGLALALVGRAGVGAFIVERTRSFRVAAGPSLTLAAGLSALCLGSFALLLAHIWVGPIVFASIALVMVAVHYKRVVQLLRTGISRVRWRWILAAVVVALPISAAVVLSVLNASTEDVTHVQEILDDRSALHVPQ